VSVKSAAIGKPVIVPSARSGSEVVIAAPAFDGVNPCEKRVRIGGES
jgi:hypothetical protein